MKANSQFDAKTLTDLSDEQLQAMQQAGKDIDNCYRLLQKNEDYGNCLLYTSPSPRDLSTSRMPSSA